MPTYEYNCRSCEKNFEFFQKMTDNPLTTCPDCKKDTLRRLIGTGAGLIFRGNGFYSTDYRTENYKKAENKEKESACCHKKENNNAKTENEKAELMGV